MGGEKRVSVDFLSTLAGSPPHGRGKVLCAGGLSRSPGITPAWAGKRGPVPVKLGRSRDHPRMGGEKAGVHLALLGVVGSPPRGRGKGTHAGCAGGVLGITPA